jgi:ABC-type sugar transport system ATPase subunit
MLDSTEYCPASPRDAIKAGVGLLSEDRNRYGLILQMDVRKNISLSNLSEVSNRMFVDATREKEIATSYVDRLNIKPPDVMLNVQALSGGNRQKVILARWLFTRSRLLIFDEPTAGIDVGAKHDIYQLMNSLAQEGVAITMISSDLPELLGICDRIAVMCGGRITGVLERNEATQETILSLATPATEETHHAA